MDQAVLLYCSLSDARFGAAWEREVLGALANDLAELLADAGVGEFDGTDVGDGTYTFYLYGEDADELLEAIQPLLTEHIWAKNIVAVKTLWSARRPRGSDRY